MAKGAFRCPKCDRVFSMAAHLARHANTMHGRVGRSKKAKAGGMRGRPGRFQTTAQGVEVNGEGAIRVLREMEAYRDTLIFRRSTIEHQIAGIENAMSAMGTVTVAAPTAKRRGRPVGTGGRAGSLKDMIVKVLRQRSKPLTPQEIADGVVTAGYKTSSKNLTKAVSNALPGLKLVRKVDRGLYQV